MLEVGNGGLTNEEERSHFALWSFAKAPLILGCDLNTIKPESLAIITNQHLIKVNQDPLGKQAVCVQNCGIADGIEVFGAPQVSDGGYFGIVGVNWSDLHAHPIAIDFVGIGATTDPTATCQVHDLWTGGHVGNY
jgi:alpha-galactosidase